MASLTELLKKEISVQELMLALLTELKDLSGDIFQAPLSGEEEAEYEKILCAWSNGMKRYLDRKNKNAPVDTGAFLSCANIFFGVFRI